MTDECAAWRDSIPQAAESGYRAALMTWLDQAPTEVEACIQAGLEDANRSGDWATWERYVVVAHERPSSRYTAVLCEVLSRQGEDVNLEDIVDVLAVVRDPASVDCLEETLRWRPPWDEFHQLAVKCLWALGAVGTPEALTVLREAATYDVIEIREAAAHQLHIASS